MGLLAKRGALVLVVHLPHDNLKSRNDNRGDSQCHCHTSTDVARLDLGYSIDVARLDLGCDGESWHRSKPLQRCKLKITGLCKTLHSRLYNVGVFKLYNSGNLRKLSL